MMTLTLSLQDAKRLESILYDLQQTCVLHANSLDAEQRAPNAASLLMGHAAFIIGVREQLKERN